MEFKTARDVMRVHAHLAHLVCLRDNFKLLFFCNDTMGIARVKGFKWTLMLTGLVVLTRGRLDNKVRNAGHKVVTTHSVLSSPYSFELCLTISVLHNGIVHRMNGKEDILKSVCIVFSIL